jgi:hypothetical protein
VRNALAKITNTDLSGMSEGDLAALRDDTLRSFDMRITASYADADRQATIAFNPFVEKAAEAMVPQYEQSIRQGMNEEAGAAFDAMQAEAGKKGGEIYLPSQEYTNAVELAKNLFSFNGIDSREQQVLDTLSNPSSTPEEMHEAIDYVGSRFYVDTSTRDQRNAYLTLANEDSPSRDREQAAQALTEATRVDWEGLQKPTISPYEAIGMREAQIASPDTSAEDKARLQQEVDLLRQAASSGGIEAAMMDRYTQASAPGASFEDQMRLYQEMNSLQQIAQSGVGDGRSQLDHVLPPQDTFSDLSRRTVENYFNGPLGSDANANPQQTLDQFGLLNPQLATFHAETVELNPESQRIEDREAAAERGGFASEWQAAVSALAAKRAEDERRLGGQQGGEEQS